MPWLTRQGQADKCSVRSVWTRECKGEQNIGGVYFCPEASISNRDVRNVLLRPGSSYLWAVYTYVQRIHHQGGSIPVDRLIIDCLACDRSGLLWRGLSNPDRHLLYWRWTRLSQDNGSIKRLTTDLYRYLWSNNLPLLRLLDSSHVLLCVLPSSSTLEDADASLVLLSSYRMDAPLVPQRRVPFVLLCDFTPFPRFHPRQSPPPPPSSYAPAETCALVARTGRPSKSDQQGASSLFIPIRRFLRVSDECPSTPACDLTQTNI